MESIYDSKFPGLICLYYHKYLRSGLVPEEERWVDGDTGDITVIRAVKLHHMICLTVSFRLCTAWWFYSTPEYVQREAKYNHPTTAADMWSLDCTRLEVSAVHASEGQQRLTSRHWKPGLRMEHPHSPFNAVTRINQGEIHWNLAGLRSTACVGASCRVLESEAWGEGWFPEHGRWAGLIYWVPKS